jgi:hypothetical protein
MKQLNSLKPRFQGTSGKQALFQVSPTHLQWKLYGDADWQDLTPLASLAPNKMPVSGGVFTGNIQIKNILETNVNANIVDGAVTLNMAQGSVFSLYLIDNISNINVINIPSGDVISFSIIVTQNSTEAKTLIWQSNVQLAWPSNQPPLVTSELNKIDIYSFLSIDAGVSFFGFSGGQAYT